MESDVLLTFSGVAASILTLILGVYFTEARIGRAKLILLFFITGCGLFYWIATILLLLNYHYKCLLLLELGFWLIIVSSIGVVFTVVVICIRYYISYKRGFAPEVIAEYFHPPTEEFQES